MADQKISELTALTSVADADLLAIVDDPSGTPTTKKITKANLVASLDGGDVANVANDQTTPGLPVVFPIAIAGGAAADTDITIDGKHRVIDAWAQHTGGAGEASDTIQVKNAGNAITDAMDWSGADNVIVRATEINDANSEIADSGTLRVTTTDDDAGDDVGAGIVYVLAIPVA